MFRDDAVGRVHVCSDDAPTCRDVVTQHQVSTSCSEASSVLKWYSLADNVDDVLVNVYSDIRERRQIRGDNAWLCVGGDDLISHSSAYFTNSSSITRVSATSLCSPI